MASTKTQKILRRTLVGGSLVAALALLLVWNDRADVRGVPAAYAVALVLLATLVETSRMGSLALLDLRPPLFVAGIFGVVTLFDRGQLARLPVLISLQHFEGPRDLFRALEFLVHSASAILGGLATFGVVRLAARFLPLAAAHLVAYGAAFYVFMLLPERFEPDVAPWVPLGGLAALAAVSLPFALREPNGARRSLIVAGLCAWIVPALVLLPRIFADWDTRGLVAFLVLSKIGDTFGYYVGNAIGKTHPFPSISPGKTTAGCVGSFVGAVGMALALSAAGILPSTELGLVAAALAGAVLNLAAQSGDLLESWVKRRVGVKDSSTVLGPSGGLLDQVDSFLITVPMCLVVWPFLFDNASR